MWTNLWVLEENLMIVLFIPRVHSHGLTTEIKNLKNGISQACVVRDFWEDRIKKK